MQRLSLTSVSLLKVAILLLVLGILIPLGAQAQCGHNPVIMPEALILCPNSQDTLFTQQGADSYQWYQDTVPIAGATDYFLPVDQFTHAGYVYYVEATIDSSTQRSAGYLLDSWVFNPPYVIQWNAFGTGGFIDPQTILLHFCKGDTLFLELGLPYRTKIQWFDGNSAITGAQDTLLAVTQTGDYWVEAAPMVCPDFVQNLGVMISVVFHNDEPQVVALGSTTLCTGDSVILASSVQDSIRWNTGETTPQIVVRQPGRYWVTFQGYGGCSLDSANSIVVTALNRPGKPVATANTPTVGQNLTLFASTVSGATGYSWTGPGGFTSSDQNPTRANAQPSMSGAYIVRAVGANGCESEADTVIVNINNPSGIDTDPAAALLAVYPNPTNGLLNLRLADGHATATLELRDLMGRTVWAGSVVGAATLDLSAQPAGVYLLVSQAGQQRSVQRVVVN